MSIDISADVRRDPTISVLAADIPVLYEDEGLDELGESVPHNKADSAISAGLVAHFVDRPNMRVLTNLNLHYHPVDRGAYVSPDEMIVEGGSELDELKSYVIGEDGPRPLVTIEVLSKRSYQQQDLSAKPQIYAFTGVLEYILVDVPGEFMAERLLLKRLQPDGTWRDHRDADGGVTSMLGFRITIEPNNELRLLDAATGKKYLRPNEVEPTRIALETRRRSAELLAEQECERTEQERERAEAAEQRAAKLEAELAQLRKQFDR